MDAKALHQLQDEITRRIVGDDEPIERDPFEGFFSDVRLYNLSKNIACEVDHYGIMSRADAVRTLSRIATFYERATDEDIRILSLQTRECLHCGGSYSEDDFYPISTAPQNLNFSHRNRRTGEPMHPYCKSCVYKCGLPKGGNHPGFVYLAELKGVYKIGRSGDPAKRMLTLRREYGEVAVLVCAIEVEDMYLAEAALHTQFLHRHFEAELFDLTPADVEYIKGLAK